MIRYISIDEVYYSLTDVTNWLLKEGLLTKGQGDSFLFTCKAQLATKLADAYQRQCVYQHLQPIVLPLDDYFVHWIVWAKLLVLLPSEIARHRKVHTLHLLLDNPDTVYLFPEIRYDIILVCLNDQFKVPVN